MELLFLTEQVQRHFRGAWGLPTAYSNVGAWGITLGGIPHCPHDRAAMWGFHSAPSGAGERVLLTVVGSHLLGCPPCSPTGHTPVPSRSSTTVHTSGAPSEWSPVPPTPHGTCTPLGCCINYYCTEVSSRLKSKLEKNQVNQRSANCLSK